MKKVSIIYWSNGGNVEVIANAIAEGAKNNGAEVNIKHVSEAKIEDVTSSDAIAFGSPSMDNNRIEQQEMEPFIKEIQMLPNNEKKLVLFGSYGWDNGAFMEDWVVRMKGCGFNVVGDLAVKEAPSEKELQLATELGKELSR